MTKLCHTCELIKTRDDGNAPLWDNIYRTNYWDVVHCNATSYLGWLILVVRRHVPDVAGLNPEESAELGPLIQQVSQALKEETGCIKTYVVQFAESPNHQHVHFHIIPRMADHPKEDIALGMFKYLGVPENERLSDEEMNIFAQSIQFRLKTMRGNS